MALRSVLSILLLCSRTLAVDSPHINYNAKPFIISFAEDDSIGPDGPWWYIPQSISSPNRNISMVPSLSKTSLAINSSACEAQQNACPYPTPTMWTKTNSYRYNNGTDKQSEIIDPPTWDADYAALLRLEGEGRFFRERFTLHDYVTDRPQAFLDIHGMGISQDYEVTFPGGAAYTKDTGFFSLYGAELSVNWTGSDGNYQEANRTLPDAFSSGHIPSTSYGLHLGSVNPPVKGSLTLGGYDSSRCLTDPIISDSDHVQLLDIALNVSGDSAYLDAGSVPVTGLLQANGFGVNGMPVYPRPGVPYMYLPKDTCDAIAAHLPVTYNEDFNLYFWNTDDRAYNRVLSSPHYLAFTFATTSGQNSSINVPLAVLNLTLESPLTSTPTKYFPCSPWDPVDTGYTLGSAFLQAAFLAKNWQTEKMYLAQAPGPDYLSPMVKQIEHTDTTLAPATNPPDWESTWSSALKPLAGNQQPNVRTGSTDSNASSSTSSGAIAGIVVGAIVALALAAALVFFLIRRRREAARQRSIVHPADKPGSLPPGYASPMPGKESPQPAVEVEAKPPAAEMDSNREVQELAGSEPERGRFREGCAVGPLTV